jgi:alpha-galactosidase
LEDLAMTPLKGWDRQNTFRCKINEKLIRNMADAIVTSGMKDATYKLVNIDGCWQGKRDGQGLI